MKIQNKILLIIAILVAGVIVLSQSAYIVKETEQVVVTQFGKPVGEPQTEPGLKFKTPFVQKANYFEKRYLEWDGDPNQVPTKNKKFIFVDTYARWQITDPLQFFKRLTNERGAQSRLDDILDGETRDFVASHKLEELVRSRTPCPILMLDEKIYKSWYLNLLMNKQQTWVFKSSISVLNESIMCKM
jgi:membrane protease subunit HflC